MYAQVEKSKKCRRQRVVHNPVRLKNNSQQYSESRQSSMVGSKKLEEVIKPLTYANTSEKFNISPDNIGGKRGISNLFTPERNGVFWGDGVNYEPARAVSAQFVTSGTIQRMPEWLTSLGDCISKYSGIKTVEDLTNFVQQIVTAVTNICGATPVIAAATGLTKACADLTSFWVEWSKCDTALRNGTNAERPDNLRKVSEMKGKFIAGLGSVLAGIGLLLTALAYASDPIKRTAINGIILLWSVGQKVVSTALSKLCTSNNAILPMNNLQQNLNQ